MKILVNVIVQSQNQIRDFQDLGQWDTYGASNALSEALPLFSKSLFQMPKSGNIGRSYTEGYAWNILVYNTSTMQRLNITQYPTIIFTNGTKEIGRIEGTPRTQADVNTYLKSIMPKSNKSNYVWALALVGLAMPKEQLNKIFK
jgi:hypothetical protein